MSEQDAVAVVRHVYEAFGRRSTDDLLALLHVLGNWRFAGPAPYAGHRRALATSRMSQDWAHVFTQRDGKVSSVRLIEDTAGHAIFDTAPGPRGAQLGSMGVNQPPFGVETDK